MIAKDIEARTMTLQYLEALKEIGASPSTKVVVPMELSSQDFRRWGRPSQPTGNRVG